jgi:hypothetical protein
MKDRDPDDVGRERVAGELDPAETEREAAAQGPGQRRFSDTGHVFDQDMAAAEQCHEHELDLAALPDHDTLDVAGYSRSQFLNSLYLHVTDGSLYGGVVITAFEYSNPIMRTNDLRRILCTAINRREDAQEWRQKVRNR